MIHGFESMPMERQERWPDPPLVCVLEAERGLTLQVAGLLEADSVAVRAFSSTAEYFDAPLHRGPCCLLASEESWEQGRLDAFSSLGGRTERAVILARGADVPTCVRAMKWGAVDFLVRPFEEAPLVDAIGRALDQSQDLWSMRVAQASALARFASLTPREYVVMQGVIAGQLNKQIAARLGIAEKTIKVHRGRVMHKTGIASVADLVRLALVARLPSEGLLGHSALTLSLQGA